MTKYKRLLYQLISICCIFQYPDDSVITKGGKANLDMYIKSGIILVLIMISINMGKGMGIGKITKAKGMYKCKK